MKFGVREICDVVFKAKSDMKIGKTLFKKGQPVIYIDSAKTSTLEGASTTVYATGGKGNTNLIAWSGEKTLTFTVEDALLSPIGFTILSGAGLFNGPDENGNGVEKVHVHKTYSTTISSTGTIEAESILGANNIIDATAPIFVVIAEDDGSVTGEMLNNLIVGVDANGKQILTGADTAYATKKVFVDCYTIKESTNVNELQIQAADLAGNFYVEASTLFRDKNGKDLPAEITIPNVKVQSNFTFSMAATGDPSTFSFVMDAFPDYTVFDNTQKVLCVIQIINETAENTKAIDSVMPHDKNEKSKDDSVGSDTKVTVEVGIKPENSRASLLGKSVSDLQSGIAISNNVISGTLKYVSDYTGFSSDAALTSGNYLAFRLDDPETYDSATFEVVGGTVGHPVAFDDDKNAVIRITDKDAQSLKIVVTVNGVQTTKEYSFGGLRLATA